MTEVSAVRALQRGSNGTLARLARAGLWVVGLVVVAWVVHLVRTDRVVAAVRRTAPWLPVVFALEIIAVGLDLLALRRLLGMDRRKVRPTTWWRSSALAYVSAVLLPMGRAAGEAARATVLSSSVGGARAMAACVRLQGCALLANAGISLLIAAVLTGGHGDRRLAAALVFNGVLCAALGMGVLVILRDGLLGRWLRRRFADAAPTHEVAPDERVAPLPTIGATLFCFLGRVAQTFECGVLLYAVGGSVTPTRVSAAEGILVVGALVGDLIPNQLGATEGAYLAFSEALGFTNGAAAVSVPIVIHVVQLILAAVCVLGAGLLADHPAEGKR
jgi:hypothetical protein